MRLTLDPVENLEGVRHDWASLAERAGNPFLTWEWASTWWHHFGAGRKLRATACRAPDGEVRAILPLYEAAVRPVVAALEDALAPLDARPHWGKVFAADAATLAERYPKVKDFIALAAKYDPNGKFRNEYLDTFLPLG